MNTYPGVSALVDVVVLIGVSLKAKLSQFGVRGSVHQLVEGVEIPLS